MILRIVWHYGVEYVALPAPLLRYETAFELGTFERCKPRYLPDLEYRLQAVSTRLGSRTQIDLVYKSDQNTHIGSRTQDIDWGIVRVVLVNGKLSPNECRWIPEGGSSEPLKGIEEVDKAERRDVRSRLRRVLVRTDQAKFRSRLLDLYKQCVITGETTRAALEAAHIEGYAGGGGSTEGNGVVLRADLHRLYDSGVFKFTKAGRVTIVGKGAELSDTYRTLLDAARPSKLLRTMSAKALQRKADGGAKRLPTKRARSSKPAGLRQ